MMSYFLSGWLKPLSFSRLIYMSLGFKKKKKRNHSPSPWRKNKNQSTLLCLFKKKTHTHPYQSAKECFSSTLTITWRVSDKCGLCWSCMTEWPTDDDGVADSPKIQLVIVRMTTDGRVSEKTVMIFAFFIAIRLNVWMRLKGGKKKKKRILGSIWQQTLKVLLFWRLMITNSIKSVSELSLHDCKQTFHDLKTLKRPWVCVVCLNRAILDNITQ